MTPEARILLCAQAICDSEASLAWGFIEARCGEPFSDDRYRTMRANYIHRARYVLAFLDGANAPPPAAPIEKEIK